MAVKDSIAYQYAKWCLEEGNFYVGKYVKLQAASWMKIVDGADEEAYIDETMYEKMQNILALMVHPDLQQPMTDGLEPYAQLLITAVFCTKLKNDEGKDIRYYENALLEIGRKNFKTFACAVIFILLMLTEPNFSRFFSVAPDLKLSSELKGAFRKIVKSSPALVKHFKILGTQINCYITDSEYIPLAYSNDGMDGKLANAFLADEAGALDDYPVEAMRSSQITLFNKLGMIISTQYPNDDNVFIDEVDNIKKMLDGLHDDKRNFGLLYEPDEELIQGDAWKTEDKILYQANPVAVSYEYIFENLKKKRRQAILYPNKRENFLCKHCNIRYKGLGVESYIEITSVLKCRIPVNKDFWRGKKVYIGLDLSMTEDNTAVAMSTTIDGYLYTKVWGFIPGDKKEEKREKEHVDYDKLIQQGVCFESDGEVIDYGDVERLILGLEDEYGVEIVQVGYDPHNALSTVQKLETAGYECVQIKQHSMVLHMPTKLLKEAVLGHKFFYEENRLLEINFENARCVFDTNMNRYVNKKKSAGKVDMVVAVILSVYLCQQYILYGNSFVVQVI